MQVATRNIGTINAEGTRLAVVMPDGLTLTSSVPAIAAQSGDTLFFNLGEIPPFQANIVNMVVKTTCDCGANRAGTVPGSVCHLDQSLYN